MLLNEIFSVQHIKLNLKSGTKDETFAELVETIIALHPELNRHDLLEAITMRENRMNTAVAPGVAIPHGYCYSLGGMVGAIGISHAGIEYDTEVVHCIFMVLMSYERHEKYLSILSKLLKLLNSKTLSEMQMAKSAQELNDILHCFEESLQKELI